MRITTILMLVLLVGCAPIYIPNAAMVFNSAEQGDYSINMRQGASSTNVQGGYALTDRFNLGVQANALYAADNTVTGGAGDPTVAYEANLIAGYYSKFTAKHTIEINAGLGGLIFENPEELSNYLKAYIQPGLTFNVGSKKSTDLTFLTRAVGLSFSHLENGRDTSVFQGYIEPMVCLSVGDKFRFNMQMGVSAPFNQNYFRETTPFILNVGIGYTLPKSRKRATLP